MVVPGLVGEGGLHDGQVVLVLGVERLQRLQAVTVGVAQPGLHGQDEQEVVGHPGGGVGGLEDPEGLDAVAVLGGQEVVGLDTAGRALVLDLEAGCPPTSCGAGQAVGHHAGGAAGQRGVGGRQHGGVIHGQGQRGAHDRQRQSSAGGQPLSSVGQLVPVAVVPQEQHQLGAAVVPVVDADVDVLAPGLGVDGRADPLATGELGGGQLDLGDWSLV